MAVAYIMSILDASILTVIIWPRCFLHNVIFMNRHVDSMAPPSMGMRTVVITSSIDPQFLRPTMTYVCFHRIICNFRCQ